MEGCEGHRRWYIGLVLLRVEVPAHPVNLDKGPFKQLSLLVKFIKHNQNILPKT